MDAADSSPEDKGLSEALEVLASPVRLSMLRHLRSAKALREIAVKAVEEGSSRAPRPLARQTVRDHLDRLLAIGVVEARAAERDYGPTTEYILNHQALYAIAEEFRALAALRPASEPRRPTMVQPTDARDTELRGPSLVLVKGLEDGRLFPLPEGPGGSPVVIGRRRGLGVSLDYDPFVSAEHARVHPTGEGHELEDLPDSRNGTEVNFRRLAKGARHPLRHGDLVGVGRTLLLYHGSPG